MTNSPSGPSLIAAAVRLADVLATENAALATMNMTAAASLLPEKLAAADAFAAAQAMAQVAGQHRESGAEEAELAALANRLQALAAENRQLLERAMVVQSRVIATVATVAKAARATAERSAMPGYGARGSAHGLGRAEACAVLTKA